MAESGTIVEHLKEFNTVTSQLTLVGINYDDDVRALLILSSLPNSWDGLVMALSNSLSSRTLKFVNVVRLIISEEVHKKKLGEASSSGRTLNMKCRRRVVERG